MSQFHYGSIEIYDRDELSLESCTSQFHYGSIEIDFIRVVRVFCANPSQFHYGSIEICFPKEKEADVVKESQFHYGSIEIKKLNSWSSCSRGSLNSIMVRLKCHL